jgi:glycerol-3-phosphate dehydrogenase
VKGYSTALRIYDITGGWRIGTRYRRITRDEALAHLPTLKSEHLVAGFLYMDARGDDARVALTIARTAALDFGADVANYVRALDIHHGLDGKVDGVTCRNELDDSTFAVRTKTVVNATGVWADSVFSMAEHEPSHRITPAKGVHLSVSRDRLPADVAAVLNVPGDRRSIFVVPFDDAPYTFIGTTDTAYEGPLDSPDCTPEDVQYLLGAVNAWTSSDLSPHDVTGVWAGLRPLLAPKDGARLSERTADLSRRHQVTDSTDGVVHITGGKWTTYRQMGEDTVDALAPYFKGLKNVRTKNLRLHGVSSWRPGTELESHLYRRFGSDTSAVLSLIEQDPSLADPLIEGQPYVGAEFVYCARHEMATSLVDLLARRTRAHLHDARATLRAASSVASLVAPALGWNDEEQALQVNNYRMLVQRELSAAGLDL